jgi:hypothetical protein
MMMDEQILFEAVDELEADEEIGIDLRDGKKGRSNIDPICNP